MSEYELAIIEAHKRGYRITDDGVILNPQGIILRGTFYNDYWHFTIKISGRSKRVRFHRLQAFQKYGEQIFDPELQVRHLDGNSQNNTYDNIGIGTQSDNMMDMTFEARSAKGKLAGEVIRAKFAAMPKKEKARPKKKEKNVYELFQAKDGSLKERYIYMNPRLFQ